MILLVRHGETRFNVERRAQGLKDSPLTELGVRQAHAMASLIHDLVLREPPGLWRLVSSPLGRARATAEIVAARVGLPVALDERVREHSMGEFDGLAADEFVPRFRADIPEGERHFHTPGGESYEAIRDRIADFLGSAPHGGRMIVVSHGAAGRILRGVYGNLTKAEMVRLDVPQDAVYRLQNGQIDRFDCEPVE